MNITKHILFSGLGIFQIHISQVANANCNAYLLAPEGFPAAAEHFGVHLQGTSQPLPVSNAIIADELWKFKKGEVCKNSREPYEFRMNKSRSDNLLISCDCINDIGENMFSNTIRCLLIDKS